mmetsp:Transcript_31751/g.88970  ORF Transcript_31751/g.88970 Transcript_31751/m.88970 type:complete len:137 (+) Transcript_31751:79-489(+)
MSEVDPLAKYEPDWKAFQLMQVCGDCAELCEELIELYKSSFEDALAKLNKAIAEKNKKDAKLYSHDIKGASANVGGVLVSSVARELELLAMDEKFEEMPKLIEALEKKQKKLIGIFKELLANFPEDYEIPDDDEYY